MGMMTPIQSTAPAVLMHDGVPMADSRDVARFFEREHKSVLRSIKFAACSEDFRRRNFAPLFSKGLDGTENISHVMMTKDGFAFVVLAFTGDKAARFREAYIDAFNAMEARLRQPAPAIDLDDNDVLRRLLLQRIERVDELQQQLVMVDQQLDNTSRALTIQTNMTRALDRDLGAARGRIEAIQPKAMAYDRLANATGSHVISDVAKDIGMRPGALFEFLDTQSTNPNGPHWIYRRKAGGDWVCSQRALDCGYVDQVIEEVELPDGRTVTRRQARITDKGRARLAEILSLGKIQPRLEL